MSTISRIRRASLFPIIDEEGYRFAKLQESMFWSANELSFIDDKKGYATLEDNEKRLLDIILSFFLPGDGLVNNNLIHRFLQECETAEETMMFINQMAIEIVHAETYGLMFYTLYDEDKINDLQEMAESSPYMRKKIDTIEKWTNSERTKPERLLAFACVEGIFFSVLFAVIFWFRSKKNVLPNLIHSNELIAKDETLHRDYGCYLFKKRGGLPWDEAIEIIKEFVGVETEFIGWLVGQGVSDLTEKDLVTFLHLVADNLLAQAGYSPYYKVTNPFSWMNDIALVQKNNFYEIRGGSYTRGSLSDILDWKARAGKGKKSESNIYDDPTSIDF